MIQIPTHATNSFFTLHGVMFPKCVNMDVHESGKNDIALHICDLLIQTGFQMISNLMNTAIEYTNIRPFNEFPIHEQLPVSNNHTISPLSFL